MLINQMPLSPQNLFFEANTIIATLGIAPTELIEKLRHTGRFTQA